MLVGVGVVTFNMGRVITNLTGNILKFISQKSVNPNVNLDRKLFVYS